MGASFQVSPEDLEKVKVFTAYYLARFPGIEWLSLLVQGVKQDSDVSTLGGVAVAGRGEILGGRAIITCRDAKILSFTDGRRGLQAFRSGCHRGAAPKGTDLFTIRQ